MSKCSSESKLCMFSPKMKCFTLNWIFDNALVISLYKLASQKIATGLNQHRTQRYDQACQTNGCQDYRKKVIIVDYHKTKSLTRFESPFQKFLFCTNSIQPDLIVRYLSVIIIIDQSKRFSSVYSIGFFATTVRFSAQFWFVKVTSMRTDRRRVRTPSVDKLRAITLLLFVHEIIEIISVALRSLKHFVLAL